MTVSDFRVSVSEFRLCFILHKFVLFSTNYKLIGFFLERHYLYYLVIYSAVTAYSGLVRRKGLQVSTKFD